MYAEVVGVQPQDIIEDLLDLVVGGLDQNIFGQSDTLSAVPTTTIAHGLPEKDMFIHLLKDIGPGRKAVLVQNVLAPCQSMQCQALCPSEGR